MSKERELLKRCADQLNSTLNGTTSMRLAEEIKELLAQPEQEPVAIDENTSDGYHTFKELYEFRKAYNVALFKMYQKQKKNMRKDQMMNNGGKGSKRRPTDEQKYQDNWDQIFGKKKKEEK